MAERTGLDFVCCSPRRFPTAVAARRIEYPTGITPLVEPDGKSEIGDLLPSLIASSPGYVACTGTVASLAGNVYFGPCRRVAVGLLIVAARNIGRMTLRAHEIPVLLQSGPM